jgi:3-methyl-2-oxobutanoate hydroxymethyltransferase
MYMQNRGLRYPADWSRRKSEQRPISVVTVYDASSAGLAAQTNVDALLVGDSLGMVVQGERSTLPVTLDQMIYHSEMARRGAPESFLIGDLPFGSYHASREQGSLSAARLMKEGGVDAVKLEGATEETLSLIRSIVEAGIPVMGHIGLTPQSYLNLGGYRVQGRDQERARSLISSARRLQEAGCFSIVLEYVQRDVAGEISQSISIPTIGIGSGPHTDGQVLVWHDLLGLDAKFSPKHAKRYANLAQTIREALNQYDSEVKEKAFPGPENSFD